MGNDGISSSNMFNVPTISFIAGTRQEFIFHLYELYSMIPHSLEWVSTVNFRMAKYDNLNDNIVNFSYTKSYEYSPPYNLLKLAIQEDSTFMLYGKFIYQISLINTIVDMVIIQGLFNIYRNVTT